MTLREYLTKQNITYRQFAETLGRDGAEVWRWAHGRRVPPLPVALQIQSVTEGRVTPADFVGDVA